MRRGSEDENPRDRNNNLDADPSAGKALGDRREQVPDDQVAQVRGYESTPAILVKASLGDPDVYQTLEHGHSIRPVRSPSRRLGTAAGTSSTISSSTVTRPAREKAPGPGRVYR